MDRRDRRRKTATAISRFGTWCLCSMTGRPMVMFLPLPKPSIDTGMGLERIAAVMQGVHNNYDIDLFASLITAIVGITGTEDRSNQSLRVIADHIRSCAFLVVDGVVPSNEGRGYVLRRIIRRAIRHANKLGVKEPFFYKLVAPLIAEMGAAYPELAKAQEQVERVLLQEEEQFARTLEQGLKILEQDLTELSGDTIPGETIFKLYDTYGFPYDLTADIARERNLQMDEDGFKQAMGEQRERARAASQFGVDLSDVVQLEGRTEFSGYQQLSDTSPIVTLIKDGEEVESLQAGDEAAVVLTQTPFYGESGGQVGDSGWLEWAAGRFRVTDTQKQGNHHIHQGVVDDGQLTLETQVTAQVDAASRQATALNHSATHLLHAALRKVLGDHVTQKGSLVDAEKLRFDFSHFEAVTSEQLQAIETAVNQQVQSNSPVVTEVMPVDAALEKGAMALFGEKYDDQVRVLTMGDGYSVELCGGTHVNRTGDIGLIKVVSEGGIAAGVRRIEAVTGNTALAYLNAADDGLQTIAAAVKGSRDDALVRVDQLVARNKQLEKELAQLKGQLASAQGNDLSAEAVEVNGVKVLAHAFDGVDPKSMLSTLDQLKNKLGSAVVLLASVNGDKVNLAAGVTKDQTGRVKAGELVNMVAEQVGGRGGGRPDMAQAGGKDPAGVPAAIASVLPWVTDKLA